MTRSRAAKLITGLIVACLLIAACSTNAEVSAPSGSIESPTTQDQETVVAPESSVGSQSSYSDFVNVTEMSGPRMLGLVATTSSLLTYEKDDYLTAALTDHLTTIQMMRRYFEALDGRASGTLCDTHAILLSGEKVIDTYLETWIKGVDPNTDVADLVSQDWTEIKRFTENLKTVCYRWDARECLYQTAGTFPIFYSSINDQLRRDGYGKNIETVVIAFNKLNKARKKVDALADRELSCDPSREFTLEPGYFPSCEKQPISTFDINIDTSVNDEKAEYFLEAYAESLSYAAVNVAATYCELNSSLGEPQE
jgi:hypothetical protein